MAERERHERENTPSPSAGGDGDPPSGPSRARTTRISRRAALTLLATGAGAALLAACAPQAPAPSGAASGSQPAGSAPSGAAKPAESKPAESKPAAAQPAAGQPKSGGRLRVAQTTLFTDVEVHRYSQGGNLAQYTGNQLLIYDLERKIVPQLAESYDAGTDLKEFKLNLRKGVQFHNGRELTSEDVKWNILRVRDPALAFAQLRPMSELFSSVETPDKYTVIVKAEKPVPAAFDFFDLLYIQDKETAEGPDKKTKSVGTGPFVWSEFVQGERVVLTKNKNYWESGKPYLDEIVFTQYADPQAGLVALEGGSVDAGGGALRDHVRLEKDPTYTVYYDNSGGSGNAIFFPVFKPPFDKKAVRQALNYTIDRQRWAEQTFLGKGLIANLPWPSVSPGYDAAQDKTYGFDMDKAKSLLSGAGFSSGEFTLSYQNNPIFQDLGTIWQQDLQKIGISLKLEPLEFETFASRAVSYQLPSAGAVSFAFNKLEPSTYLNIQLAYRPDTSYAKFSDPKYTQLLAQVSVEPDAAKRKALYHDINALLLDEAFTTTFGFGPASLPTKSYVKNVRYRAVRPNPDYTEVWLDR